MGAASSLQSRERMAGRTGRRLGPHDARVAGRDLRERQEALARGRPMMPALQSALVRVLAAWLAGGALLAGAAGLDAVRADEGYFIGDSIAAATAQTIGMRGSAHHSVSQRRNAIAPQFLQVPKGAVALMTLGLNDAAIPVSAMHKDIETVIEGAQRTGERIVWIGPPCVLKSWDNRAREMDDYLRRRLATTNIQYVSL